MIPTAPADLSPVQDGRVPADTSHPVPDGRLVDLLNLTSTILLDIDDAGRLLIGDDSSGVTQLAEYDADGTRHWLTALAEPCTGRYLPGRRAVVVSADDGGTERAQLFLVHPAEAGGESDTVPAMRPLVTDPAYIHTLLDVAEDTIVYATNRRNGVDFDVVLRTISSGAERVLWDKGGSFDSAALSPYQRWLALSRMTLQPASSALELIDLETGLSETITDPDAIGLWTEPRWDDGDPRMPLLSSSDTDSDFLSVRSYDVGSRSWTVVLADDEADLLAWPGHHGEGIAVVATRDGADELRLYPPLAALNAADGPGPIEADLPGPGSVTFRSPIVWSPDGEALGATFASMLTPPRPFTWRPGREPFPGSMIQTVDQTPPKPITVRRGANAGTDLIDGVSHLVPTHDGEQIPVYVLTPPNADGSAVLVVHGGPEAASVRSWNPIIAGLALAGHTVVVPNVRGSSGYGRRWMSLDDVALRLDSVADLADIHAWLPTIGVDRSRAALYGGSYGGYLVLAGLAFQPDLWAAGVDIVGMSSLVTFLENTSAYRRAYREREYGRLDTDRAILEEASPLRSIGDVRAPLFVIHGANDPRVPLSEAEQVVAAVRGRGLDCPLLVYADEGHGLAKRVNKLDAYPQAFAFLARQLSTNTPRRSR